jgi:glutamine synthetase
MTSLNENLPKETRSIILEYVWIDGNMGLRSKYKTLTVTGSTLDISQWNYDGSSCYQANVDDSEVILNPIAFYNNPFFEKGTSFLVLCDTYTAKDNKNMPTNSNRRILAREVFLKNTGMEPWFGLEQEYFIINKNGQPPFFQSGYPKSQGDYYCGVGSRNIMYRELVEKHYKYCLLAGLKISGINAEVAPNQWEFQIGPCVGIEAGDQLWIARYILVKLAEKYDLDISFRPKPLDNPWNGSGLHTNFSTKETRANNGLDKLYNYIEKMKSKHSEHLLVYGDNSKRLSGHCETSNADIFSSGIGTRNTSIRIPNQVFKDKKGYLEDRRPASDADPYLITSKIFDTCCVTV